MASIATLTSGESGANSLTDINANFAAVNTIAGTFGININIGTLASATTRYWDSAGQAQSAVTDAGNVMTGSHTIKNLTVAMYQGGGGNALNGSTVFTLIKNQVAQTVTVTVSAGSTTAVTDSTHSFSVVAGDIVNLRGVSGGNSGGITFGFSYEIN